MDKPGLCYCIKNFTNYRFDKYYEIVYENDNTIFIIYNKNGSSMTSGFRFYLGESPGYNNFYDYFQIVNRAFKLKKLKNVRDKQN